eukprot:jgi/Mesen1/5276/ME000263S04373
MGAVFPAISKYISVAVAALQREEVIAVPTDTLYGVAANACSAAAIQRIYAIKERNLTKPLAICVADVADVKRFARTEHLPSGLLDSLLPGPVTLVLPRGEDSLLHPTLNPGLLGIGVRVPDHEFVRQVARSLGGALALTSANKSGAGSAIRPDEFRDMWRLVAAVFDGGEIPVATRAGSTIVDLTLEGRYSILRPGCAVEATSDVLKSKYSLKQN